MKKNPKRGHPSKKSSKDDTVDVLDNNVTSPVKKLARLSRKKSKDKSGSQSPARNIDDADFAEAPKKLVLKFGKKKHTALIAAEMNSSPADTPLIDSKANLASAEGVKKIHTPDANEIGNRMSSDVAQQEIEKNQSKELVILSNENNDKAHQDIATEQRNTDDKLKDDKMTDACCKLDDTSSVSAAITDNEQVVTVPVSHEQDKKPNDQVAVNGMKGPETNNTPTQMFESIEGQGNSKNGDHIGDHIAYQSANKYPSQEPENVERNHVGQPVCKLNDDAAAGSKDAEQKVSGQVTCCKDESDEATFTREFGKAPEECVKSDEDTSSREHVKAQEELLKVNRDASHCHKLKIPSDVTPIGLHDNVVEKTENITTGINSQVNGINADPVVLAKDINVNGIDDTSMATDYRTPPKQNNVFPVSDTVKENERNELKSDSKIEDIKNKDACIIPAAGNNETSETKSTGSKVTQAKIPPVSTDKTRNDGAKIISDGITEEKVEKEGSERINKMSKPASETHGTVHVDDLECVDVLDDLLDITFSQACQMEEQCLVKDKGASSFSVNKASTYGGNKAAIKPVSIPSGPSYSLRTEDLQAAKVIHGVIDELKGLNQMIIGAKKEIETARRLRQNKQKQQHFKQHRSRQGYQPYVKKKTYPEQ